MTFILLDTNVYLRLAKRIRPLLGRPFGQENYVVTILKDVEDEVHKNSRLLYYFPWFDNEEYVTERLAKQIRLNKIDKQKLRTAQSVLHGSVKNDNRYLIQGRHPPSPIDCKVLAFSQIRSPTIIVTDDIGMHILAKDFDIPVWYGYELIQKMLEAQEIKHELVREIYTALENNKDTTKSWEDAKKTVFSHIFCTNNDYSI